MSDEYSGRSILEILWEKLDERVDQLMADGEPQHIGMPNYGRAEYAEWGRQQGRCEELTWAIAVMTSPYDPNMGAIKAMAMDRYRARQG